MGFRRARIRFRPSVLPSFRASAGFGRGAGRVGGPCCRQRKTVSGHDARDTAAGADQHRDERFTGKTELTEDTVHDEGDTRHIAAGLKERKENEEDQHLRYKAEDCADTGNNAVQDQAL